MSSQQSVASHHIRDNSLCPPEIRSTDVIDLAQKALRALDDVVNDQDLRDLDCGVLPELILVLTRIENFPLAVESSEAAHAFKLTSRLNLPDKGAANETAAGLRRRIRDLVVVTCCRRWISPTDKTAVMNSIAEAFGEPLTDRDLGALMLARTRLFGKAIPKPPGLGNPVICRGGRLLDVVCV